MASTVFSEHNQIKWVGVRPAIDGEQIQISNSATNAIVTLYTVPASKALLLIEAHVMAVNAVTGNAYIFIEDSLGATIRYLCGGAQATPNNTPYLFDHFNPSIPTEMLAGEKIRVRSGAGGLTVQGSFTGILIDAP